MSHLLRITADNFQHYQRRIITIERLSFLSPWNLSAFEAELKKPISHLWAITEEDLLWGYICFWMFKGETQLANIAVHPLRGGERYGFALVTKMFETSALNGVRQIWLEVRPSNLDAKNLYHKFGFKEIGRRSRYYQDTNEDAIVMSSDLSHEWGCYLGSS